MPHTAKCLVIDTDIAHSAGGEYAKAGISKNCRDFLLEVRETKHKVVSTEAIREEWKRHRSRFTTTWFSTMVARKQVCWIDDVVDDTLRRKVKQANPDTKKQEIMLKDVHLIEAALKADKIVCSMDEAVRQCFCDTCSQVFELRQVVWVNPSKDEEMSIQWLHEGAEVERERLLKHRGTE